MTLDSREIIANRMNYCKFFPIKLNPDRKNNKVRHSAPKGWSKPDCSAHMDTPPKKGAYGVLQPQNAITFDCDSEETIDWIEDKLENNDTKTLVIETQSGCRHYPFKLTDEQVRRITDSTIYSRVGHPIKDVDMRGGTASYIVGAGSEGYDKENDFARKSYEVIEDREVAYLPDELFDLINAPKTLSISTDDSGEHEIPNQSLLMPQSDAGVEWGEGERNKKLSDAVYKYVCHTELSDSECLRIALEINKKRCRPQLGVGEVKEIVEQKIRKFREGLPKRECVEVPYSPSWATQTNLCHKTLGYNFVWNEYELAVSVVRDAMAPPWEKYEAVSAEMEASIDAEINSKCLTRRYFPNKGEVFAPPTIGFHQTSNARRASAFANKVYPPKEWLDSVPENNNHDWVHNIFYELYPKIDSFMFPEEYVVWVARNCLCSIAKRILVPGCVHVESLVLKGSPGCGKSAFAAMLMPTKEWFSDSLDLSQTAKEIEESTKGAIVVECPEMTGKKNRSNTIKAFNTANASRFRRAYGRNTENFKRQYIVIYTSNSDYPLPDDEDLGTLRRYAMMEVSGTYESGDKVADYIEENRINIFGAVKSILKSELPIKLPSNLKDIHKDIVKTYAEIDRGLDTLIEHAVNRLGMKNPKRSDFCKTEIMNYINMDAHRRANSKFSDGQVLQLLRDKYEPVLPQRRKDGKGDYLSKGKRDIRIKYTWDEGTARDYVFKLPMHRNNPDMFSSGVVETENDKKEYWDKEADKKYEVGDTFEPEKEGDIPF